MKENLDIFKIKTNNVPPKKGRVLIAEPFLPGNYFSRSVVFLVAHSEKGTVGFILNKEIDFEIKDVFPDFPDFDAKVFSESFCIDSFSTYSLFCKIYCAN